MCGQQKDSPSYVVADAGRRLRGEAYDVAIVLSRAYPLQQRITELNRAFFAVAYTPEFATGGVAALAGMSSYRSDLSSNEGHLVTQYDSELTQVDTYLRR